MHTNSGNLVQLGCGKEALELIRRCLQKSQSHRITKQGKCCIRQIHLRNATGATSGRSCNILHNPCAETLENVYSVGLLKCEIAASLGDCRGRREGRVSCTVKFGARSICNPSLGTERAPALEDFHQNKLPKHTNIKCYRIKLQLGMLKLNFVPMQYYTLQVL